MLVYLQLFRIHIHSDHSWFHIVWSLYLALHKFTLQRVLTQLYKWVLDNITDSALPLHCCKAHARINRKIWNLTLCKIVTHENFSSNVCSHDYVRDGNYCANFSENRFSGGFSSSVWNITPLWLYDCPVLSFFLDPSPMSNRWTDFRTLWLKRRVSVQGGAFWGLQW